MQKKSTNTVLVPSQRYQDSRHILKNSKVSKNLIVFINCGQRFTPSNYMSLDSLFENLPER